MTGMSTRLVIAAIQANPTVGAIAHNEALARERLAQAKAAGPTSRSSPNSSSTVIRPRTWR